jgi:hypothetical protein
LKIEKEGINMDFGNEYQVKLRKTKKCEWCGQDMIKGEVVYHFKGKFNGEWQDWKMHNECEEAYRKDDQWHEGFLSYSNERPRLTGEGGRV